MLYIRWPSLYTTNREVDRDAREHRMFVPNAVNWSLPSFLSNASTAAMCHVAGITLIITKPLCLINKMVPFCISYTSVQPRHDDDHHHHDTCCNLSCNNYNILSQALYMSHSTSTILYGSIQQSHHQWYICMCTCLCIIFYNNNV